MAPHLALISGLASLMVITALLISDEKSIRSAARLYSLQSGLLAAVFIVMGLAGERYLLAWAASAFITKTVLVPYILTRLVDKVGLDKDRPVLSSAATWVLSLLCVGLGFALSVPFSNPSDRVLMGVSMSLFLLGLVQVTMRRSLAKQLLGFCHFENSSHLMLAVLAPGIPETVEIGIATDAVLLIAVGSVIAYIVWRNYGSLDYLSLRMLREDWSM